MRIPKPLWIISIIIVLLFLYLPSLSHYFKLRHQEEKLGREIKEIATQIETLKREEDLIRNDLDHLEKVVRQELGLVRPGEIIYKLVPVDQLQLSPAAADSQSDHAQQDNHSTQVIQL